MKQLIYNASVLRFRPYRDLGEFVNIGVLVCFPQLNYNYLKINKRVSRITGFFPEIDKDFLNQVSKFNDEMASGALRVLAMAYKKFDHEPTEAEMENKKSADKIKHEIIEVSSVIAEKMIGREIDTENHHALIDSFIEKIGDTNE
jgi:hypothetical protein